MNETEKGKATFVAAITRDPSPGHRLSNFLSNPPSKESNRIPLSAYVGAALFVGALYALMFVGVLAGF